jgi:integrase
MKGEQNMAKLRKRSWATAAGEARTAWAVDFTDSNGERQRKQFRSRREADAFRVEIEGQLRAGTFRPDADKITVKELADAYLDHVEARQKRGERFSKHHLKVVQGHIYNYIVPDAMRHEGDAGKTRVTAFTDGIGATKLSQLTARTAGDFRDRLRNAGLSVVTTRKILGSLSAMLRYAVSQDMTAVNAAAGIKVIGKRDEGARKIVPPTKEAMKALIEAATADFKVKLIFAAATGLRAGEFHALRWRHIDFDKNEVTVETRVDAYREEDVTKTAAGMRTVPLGATVTKMLKEWKLRSKFKRPDDLIFPNRRGTYEGHDNMTKRQFHPVCEVARLGKYETAGQDLEGNPIARFKPSINWHALRHFAISCWIEAGLAPKTVQTFAGHSSLQVTMDRYAHLFKSDDHKVAMDQIAKGLTL